MESFEVLPPNTGTLASIDSEFSMISECSLPEGSTYQQCSGSCLQSALVSDVSKDEIERLLFELIEDNRLLKESLHSSNTIMKSQLSVIATLCSTVAQHQASMLVEESQTCQEDTGSMKLQLKEALIDNECLKQEIEKKDVKIKSICEENEKEKNLLKLKLVTQEGINSKHDESLSCQAEKFQEKIKTLQFENVKALNQHVAEVRALEGKLSLKQKAIEIERIKNQEDKKLLSVLQSNYDKVTKQLQMKTRSHEQKTDSQSKESQEQVDLLTARLFDCEQRLEESEEKVSMLNLEKEELEKKTQTDSQSKESQEQVDLLTARLFDCEQRLEESEAKVDVLNNELNLAKEESKARSDSQHRSDSLVYVCPNCRSVV